jgi:hypothetical protein
VRKSISCFTDNSTLTQFSATAIGNTALPEVTGDLTIRNSTLERSSSSTTDEYRLLQAGQADPTAHLTLENITLRNGRGSTSILFGGQFSHPVS